MTVLFFSSENSTRAQIAAGLARQVFASKCKIICAYSDEAPALNPAAAEVMSDFGIDDGAFISAKIKDIDPADIDFIVSLGDTDEIPLFDSHDKTRQVHWRMPNPDSGRRTFGERAQRYRELAELLKIRIRIFAEDLFLTRT